MLRSLSRAATLRSLFGLVDEVSTSSPLAAGCLASDCGIACHRSNIHVVRLHVVAHPARSEASSATAALPSSRKVTRHVCVPGRRSLTLVCLKTGGALAGQQIWTLQPCWRLFGSVVLLWQSWSAPGVAPERSGNLLWLVDAADRRLSCISTAAGIKVSAALSVGAVG